MLVSRADIRTDQIVTYDKPFMPIPIQAYLQQIDVDPIPSQIAVINGINNPKYRFGVAALSRRQGKTYIANVIGQVVSLVPGSNILVMAPNYSLSQISFELQRSLIKRFNLQVVRDNAKDKVIQLSNGSTIRIGSINQVDSCVGRSYDLIIFDQAALSNGMQAFNVALRPTLDKPNSKALFISTPRGKLNWFSQLFDRGFTKQFPQWFSVKATYHDNPRMSESDVAQARKSMSQAEFKQQYEADFSTFQGQIWKLPSQCLRRCQIGRQHMDIIAGLDLGFRDPTALVVCGYCWQDNTFYILQQYQDKQKTTAQQAAQIKRILDYWDADYTYIDSANQQMRYDFALQYDIPSINAKKSVLDGIGYIASLAHNKRIVIDPSCYNVIAAFDQYRWDAKPGLQKQKPVHDEYSHMADALRYAIYSFQANALME